LVSGKDLSRGRLELLLLRRLVFLQLMSQQPTGAAATVNAEQARERLQR